MFVFDPAAGTWTSGPKLPETVHHSSMVSTPTGSSWSVGTSGRRVTVATAAVRRLEDGAAAWTDDAPLPEPGPRAAQPSTARGSSTPAASSRAASRTRSSPDTGDGAWTRIGRLPVAREHLAATSDGAGRTFVLGGRVGGLDRNLAVVDLVAGSGEAPSGRSASFRRKRGGVAAFWWPSLGACLAGGESPGGTNPQVECMAADGTVTRLPDLGVARHGIGAAVVDGRAFVVLGGRQPGLVTSDVTEALRLP